MQTICSNDDIRIELVTLVDCYGEISDQLFLFVSVWTARSHMWQSTNIKCTSHLSDVEREEIDGSVK